ncbi:hypothetical protein VTI28DRAFT_4034 [Corynascus sepedonium]
MHPVGLNSSSMLPITNSVGCPLVLCHDRNPYTPRENVMMEKVSNMLEASEALKPEPQSEPEPASTMAKSFFKKVRPPFSLFSKPNPRASVRPHQIRHITGDLEPLPLPEQTRHIPSIYLRRNELGNLKREKALRVLGDNPSFDPFFFAVIDSPGAAQQAPMSFLSPPTSGTNEPLFSSPPRSTTTAAPTTTTTTTTTTTGAASATTQGTTTRLSLRAAKSEGALRQGQEYFHSTSPSPPSSPSRVASKHQRQKRPFLLPALLLARELDARAEVAAASAAIAARRRGGGGSKGGSRSGSTSADAGAPDSPQSDVYLDVEAGVLVHASAGVGAGASFQSPAKVSHTTITTLHSTVTAAGTTKDGTSTVGVSTSTHAFRRQPRSIPDFDGRRDAGWNAGFGTVVVSAPGPALRAVLLGTTTAEAATHREDGVSAKRHPTPAPGDLATLKNALRERYPEIARGGGLGGDVVMEEEEEEEEDKEEEKE